MTNCPSEETLAAFLDGRLPEAARREVIEHLAQCGECRTLVNDAVEFRAEESEAETAEVARPEFGRKRGAFVAVAVAVAASLLVVFTPLGERIFDRSHMPELVEAARTVSVRPGEGRLSAKFDYKPPKPRFRGEEDEQAELWRVMAEAAELESKKDRDPHALAVAHLYLGNEEEAIGLLRGALQSAERPQARTALAVDLAAALIARRDTGDAEEALALMESEWRGAKTPAVAWNRAMALQALHRDAEGVRAWGEYLELDGGSPWAEEAKRHRDSLTSR